jgi:two-component system, OmpR family, sensor histidine kinase KdpD
MSETQPTQPDFLPKRRPPVARPALWVRYGYLSALGLVMATSALCEQVRPYLSPINMVMAYLLAVVLASVLLGLKPAIVTAFLGVLAFDFFFVPPRFTFRVSDTEYFLTFFSLFIVGVVISSLVARSRERLEALGIKEQQTVTLYQLSCDLAAATDTTALLDALVSNMEGSLNAPLAVFLPRGERLELAAASRDLPLGPNEEEIALWAYRSRRPAGRGSDSFGGSPFCFLPVKALANTLGVLAIRLPGSEDAAGIPMRRLLDACATQAALALERFRLAREAQQAQILKARENLERALLNSISHDLRTPLATITGVLSAVLDEGGRLNPAAQRELLETAREEAGRLNRFVGNLLDMSRLEGGALRLRLEPCDVQDLIGCALAAVEKRLGTREVSVQLDPELPLVSLDLVLMIQVLVNLLDNALKHAPTEGTLEIAARCRDDSLFLEVADRGPGVPEADLSRIFDKFYRTPIPEGIGGTGLGLSICKGIVEAHGGSILAENREGGGLKITIKVPQGAPTEELSAHHG